MMTPLVFSISDKSNTAWHESGHALMAKMCGVSITKVAIVEEKDGWRGYCSYYKSGTQKYDAMILLAGELSEQKYNFDPNSLRSTNDYFRCYKLLDGKLELLNLYKDETEAILNSNWADVEIIASALLEDGSLTGEQVEDVLRATHSPASVSR